MTMSVTSRGKASIAIVVALAFSASLFLDLVVFTAFVVALSIVLSGLVWLGATTGLSQRFFVCTATLPQTKESYSLKATTYPGQLVSADFYFVKRAHGEALLLSEIDHLSFEPNKISAGQVATKVRANFKTPYSGEYSSQKLRITTKDPLGFFKRDCIIRAAFNFTVYPRVVDIALTTMKILGKGGAGDIPVNVPGVGTEPYDMRYFQNGDDTRQINWKASARIGKLVITERQKEVGASYYIVLDAMASNYFDKDRLASTFLQLSNSLALLRARFGIVVSKGKSVDLVRRLDEETSNTLEFALDAALKLTALRESMDLPNKLAALPSQVIKSNSEALLLMGYNLLSEIEDSGRQHASESLGQEPFKTINMLVDEHSNNPPIIFYVSSLSQRIESVVEASSYLRRMYRTELVVINPAAPWVVAQDEFEGAKLYEARVKNLEILRRANVEYLVGEPMRIVSQLISSGQ